ncbi:carbohydrate ABC transporter membrane protein 1, CUT1 family (TC 3.A.1.1.-) [Fervidobacterium changbaicum]|uniref:Sugar ABC transporter permease n=2 Tax=Fervidobacterium TaxID=2422 RepID=A0AAI8GCT0_FERIS|nr:MULTISPECIES: sugar ABC transporter permease [Fervidobacterium]AMW32521.2 sugar ABC transporter permease [Fervidobacterium islandicum]QAV32636.1 sugar ABC transporter permease [Fervidobacterium changbaicum]SDH35847.1 carbohydrate ABC transporter membrane protein 1, CUT1 family (TC 3.A.1.1.-) [Fervidobacterium changbaicum]
MKVRKSERRWIITFLSPYIVLFAIFIIVPTILAILLSFTNFNTIQFPKFVGLKNYISLFTTDSVFMQYVLPNTIKFAVLVGPTGYFLAFILAWMLAQIPRIPRTILALIIYSPSMTVGVAMQVIWLTIFSGDKSGYLNSLLLRLGIIDQPIQWLQSPKFLFPTMVVVTLWSSMGVGFLAMLAGVLNTDPEIYEAGYIDGISKRWQEIFYITIPLMRPQMLFGAVMSVVSTFQAGYIGVMLSGSNPTPQYAGQLIVNHIEDFGFMRYEMGYAAAISVVLLIMIWISSKFVWALFLDRD